MEFRPQVTHNKNSRTSVGVKRERALFLKGVLIPSRMTSDEGPYLILGKTFFFFQKQTAHRGSNRKQRLCVSQLRSMCWSLISSLLSTVSPQQVLPGPYFWSGPRALP